MFSPLIVYIFTANYHMTLQTHGKFIHPYSLQHKTRTLNIRVIVVVPYGGPKKPLRTALHVKCSYFSNPLRLLAISLHFPIESVSPRF